VLFALMVVSAQFRLAGFYPGVVRRVVALRLAEPGLLAAVMAVAGGLSAALTNDVVCLAMTPVLGEGCVRRRLDPVPYLLGLACASNIGSAATLIGNPQNILIGQRLSLGFGGFLLDAGVPALLGLLAAWALIAGQFRGRWQRDAAPHEVVAPPFDRWQSAKALSVTLVLIVVFLGFERVPRHGVALAAAGVLLLSRRMASRETLALVDWQLLVLFIGLFIVNGAFARTGAMERALAALHEAGVDPTGPGGSSCSAPCCRTWCRTCPPPCCSCPAPPTPSRGPSWPCRARWRATCSSSARSPTSSS
jgi:Na+/H+ antiporter NhaD/arsenite permease-like protein